MTDKKTGGNSVGYGRPPVQSQFKPGQSGNPSGRRRGSKNLHSIVRQSLTKKVTIREGDKIYKVTQFEAIMRNLALNAMKGDPKAIKTMLTLLNQIDLWEEDKIPTKLVVKFV
jgi:hypothetical protein